MVEYIDSYFLDKFKDVAIESGAKINTESPAWAIDRLSILALKIYHMAQEVKRTDVSAKHVEECRRKLDILLQQRTDLTTAIEELLAAQVHEGVQADEDVQRSRTESRSLRGKIDLWLPVPCPHRCVFWSFAFLQWGMSR